MCRRALIAMRRRRGRATASRSCLFAGPAFRSACSRRKAMAVSAILLARQPVARRLQLVAVAAPEGAAAAEGSAVVAVAAAAGGGGRSAAGAGGGAGAGAGVRGAARHLPG